MYNIKTKIVLRVYPKTFEWESLDKWNIRINEALEGLDVIPPSYDCIKHDRALVFSLVVVSVGIFVDVLPRTSISKT